MNIANKIKENGLLHKVHLYVDGSIAAFAIVALFSEDFLALFIQVDLVFHLLVAGVLVTMIILERVLHRHKHGGVISH